MNPAIFGVQSAVRVLDRMARWMGRNRSSTAEHVSTGKRGEEEAQFHLRRCGYVVVARNWRTAGRKGEIDLIAWERDVLCFIEVKTRTTRDVKPAEAAVDAAKQNELRAMARQYLRRFLRAQERREKGVEPAVRFDVVSVYYKGAGGRVADITLFRGAFAMA